MNPTTVKEFFQLLPSRLDSDAAEDLDAVYQFDLSGAQGGQYILTICERTCHVVEGMHAAPHVVLSMTGEDCMKVLRGQLSGTSRRDVWTTQDQRGHWFGDAAEGALSNYQVTSIRSNHGFRRMLKLAVQRGRRRAKPEA